MTSDNVRSSANTCRSVSEDKALVAPSGPRPRPRLTPCWRAATDRPGRRTVRADPGCPRRQGTAGAWSLRGPQDDDGAVADPDLALRHVHGSGQAERGIDDDLPAGREAGLGQRERERVAVRVEQQQEPGIADLL